MYESAVTIHNKETKYNHSIVRLSSEAIATYLKNENFPKYLVIRNPIARILSAYLDKVQPWLSVENRTVQHFETWIYQEFDPELPQDRDWSKTNPHWRPQVEFCGFKIRDVWSYFNVFRVEKPEEYVDFLYDIVPKKFLVDGWGKPSNFSFRDHVLGPRKRTGHTNEKVLKYFRSIAVFDHLAKKLEEDISTLGYNSEVAQLREDILEANAKKDDETDENDA